MVNFKDEIRLIAEKEREDQKTAHFRGLNPEELSVPDMEIWEKVKNESITREDFDRYRNNLVDEGSGDVKDNVPQSRVIFLAFIANKVIVIFLKKELEERKKFRQ